MKKILLKTYNLPVSKAFAGKSGLLLLAALLCFGVNLHAGVKPAKKKPHPAGAAPTLTYNSPQVYTIGSAITPLVPTSSGVAAVGFSSRNLGGTIDNTGDIAVDTAGNIYYTYSSTLLAKIPAGGGSPVAIDPGPTSQLSRVAVDSKGNIYLVAFTTPVNNSYFTNVVREIPADGSTPVILASFTDTAGTSPAQAEISGITLDKTGNIYLSFWGSKTIDEIPANGGSPTIISTGIANQSDLAIDLQGNLYIADNINNTISEIPSGGGMPITLATLTGEIWTIGVDGGGNVYVSNIIKNLYQEIPVGSSTPVTISLNVSNEGLAVDSKGNIYIPAYSVDGTIEELSRDGGYYISPELPAGLTLNSSTGVISGTPTIGSPAKNYMITGYNSAGGTSVSLTLSVTNALPPPTLSYSSGPKTYFKGTPISPLSPTSTNVQSPGHSSSPVNMITGINLPTSIAIDGARNKYVVDGNLTIQKLPVGGGAKIAIDSGLVQTQTIAADAVGNIYFCDYNTNAIKKIPVSGGAIQTLAFGTFLSFGLAIDAEGNVYASDYRNNVVKELTVSGTLLTIATGFLAPKGIAVDAAGNVYVADWENKVLKKIPAGGGTPVIIASGFTNSSYVATDVSGNVYVTDNSNMEVSEIFAGTVAEFTVATGIDAGAIAIDNGDNIYVVNYSSSVIDEFPPNGGYYSATPLPAGLSLNASTGILSGTPTAESPATNYTITAYNTSGSASANLNIKVTSTNDTLIALNVTPGILTPAFSPAIISYTDSVGIDSVKITPVLSDTLATVTVNGATVKSGINLGVPLVVGSNTIPIKITASDGVTTQTYTLTVKRVLPSSNAGLSNIVLSNGTLSPAFSTSVTSYTATTNYVSLTVTPTVLNQYATIAINGQSVNSGSPSAPIHLAYGTNTLTTQVTAQDGTIKDYTITITRMHASSTRTLAGLFINKGTLTPAFNADSGHYVVNVTDTTATITVRPQPGDATETIMVNDSLLASGKPAGTVSPRIPLVAGYNTIKVLVTAQNGLEKYYIITVIKPRSSDANLYSLVINKGTLSPLFNTDTTNYTDSVSNTTGGVAIHALPENKYATLKINGVITAPGVESPNIPLNVGNTALQVAVTAQDGTVKKYTIHLIRAASTNDDLDTIALGEHTAYTPVFNPDSTNYTAYVANNVTQLTIATHTAVTTSIIKLDGENINSNHFHYFDNLAVGSNLTTCQVIAQDGITTKTYNINIIRASADTGTTNLVDHPVTDDGIMVHKAITPNGDGINDVLTIDKITSYPDNKLMIVNSTGALVYEASGYDNKLKAFDGHSSINGKLQPPGTYFYSLQYTINGKSKTKTGYVVLKY